MASTEPLLDSKVLVEEPAPMAKDGAPSADVEAGETSKPLHTAKVLAEEPAPSVKYNSASVDVEAGETLAPGMSVTESERRWGFIQKVYGIVAAQLALTAAVGACFSFIPSWQLFALSTPWFFFVAFLSPFIMFIPLWIFRHTHPHNLLILAAWTGCLGVTTGMACSLYSGVVIVEALVLTATVVLSLTAYTFYAVRKGQDFNYLGPSLLTSLVVLVVWSSLQLFLPLNSLAMSIFALLGALLFSLFIVYDTALLITRFQYDEFVWASVNLYLDILNLFIFLLRILNHR